MSRSRLRGLGALKELLFNGDRIAMSDGFGTPPLPRAYERTAAAGGSPMSARVARQQGRSAACPTIPQFTGPRGD